MIKASKTTNLLCYKCELEIPGNVTMTCRNSTKLPCFNKRFCSTGCYNDHQHTQAIEIVKISGSVDIIRGKKRFNIYYRDLCWVRLPGPYFGSYSVFLPARRITYPYEAALVFVLGWPPKKGEVLVELLSIPSRALSKVNIRPPSKKKRCPYQDHCYCIVPDTHENVRPMNQSVNDDAEKCVPSGTWHSSGFKELLNVFNLKFTKQVAKDT